MYSQCGEIELLSFRVVKNCNWLIRSSNSPSRLCAQNRAFGNTAFPLGVSTVMPACWRSRRNRELQERRKKWIAGVRQISATSRRDRRRVASHRYGSTERVSRQAQAVNATRHVSIGRSAPTTWLLRIRSVGKEQRVENFIMPSGKRNFTFTGPGADAGGDVIVNVPPPVTFAVPALLPWVPDVWRDETAFPKPLESVPPLRGPVYGDKASDECMQFWLVQCDTLSKLVGVVKRDSPILNAQ